MYLTRVENNIESLEKQEVYLGEYLKSFTKNYFLENKIDSNKFIIEYSFKKDRKIFIEENTFNVLFGNLLSNAIKFSKTSPQPSPLEEREYIIEIGLDEKSFWIKDNGIGISKKNLENIWKKFFRKDKNIEGFGVGLFIVKRLAFIYNWQIEVESKEGKGTKFRIKFDY